MRSASRTWSTPPARSEPSPPPIGRGRLLDEDVARPGSPRAARPDRHRRSECDPPAERGQPRRPDRSRARPRSGAADYSMRMWLDPDHLARLGLTVTDVQNAIRQQNVVNPAGQIGAEPAPDRARPTTR